MAWALILFHFAVPFLILLQQDLKRKPKKLAMVAVFILFMRFVDIFCFIGPSPRSDAHGAPPEAFIVSWMDFVAPIAMGGFWVAYFLNQLMKRSYDLKSELNSFGSSDW